MFTVLSIVLGVVVGFVIDPYLGIGVGIASVIATVVVFGKKLRNARAECGTNCVGAEAAIAYLGWSGTLHQFEIGSQRFARDFMIANQQKLVNLSLEARGLLAANGSALTPSASRSPRRYIS